jgi:alkylation response protein AidB-like acyl-CoA dehydrogenase
MDFRLTDEQRDLRDAVRDYLAGEHGPELLRRLDAERRPDPAVWDGLIAMGLGGLLVGEAEGGLGLGLVEAALVAVELGRFNVSEPIADSALVAAPLLVPEQQARVAAGMLRVALGHPVNPWIADLDQAGLLYAGGAATTVESIAATPNPFVSSEVETRSAGGAFLDYARNERSKEEAGASTVGVTAPIAGIDPLRRLFAPLPCAADEHLLDRAALIAAAQLVGGAEAMLAQATDYANTREQFGQKIGGFQAIKHHLATVAVKIEFARPTLWRAAYAAEHGHARAAVAISHAKIAATDAAMLAAETAIQVHGAMGYTYEVDLHFWMKRAWALAGAWGDRAFHLRRIEAAVIGRGMAIGPDRLFESELHHG